MQSRVVLGESEVLEIRPRSYCVREREIKKERASERESERASVKERERERQNLGDVPAADLNRPSVVHRLFVSLSRSLACSLSLSPYLVLPLSLSHSLSLSLPPPCEMNGAPGRRRCRSSPSTIHSSHALRFSPFLPPSLFLSLPLSLAHEQSTCETSLPSISIEPPSFTGAWTTNSSMPAVKGNTAG